jgi:hypothetical protein
MTIFRFPIDEAAAKSLGEGKSPKLVNSDHCHISEAIIFKPLHHKYINSQNPISLMKQTTKPIAQIHIYIHPYPYQEPKNHPTWTSIKQIPSSIKTQMVPTAALQTRFAMHKPFITEPATENEHIAINRNSNMKCSGTRSHLSIIRPTSTALWLKP